MNTRELIGKIYTAKRLEDIFGVHASLSACKRAMSVLHPDICDLYGAEKAFVKLNHLREEYQRRSIVTDDVGKFQMKAPDIALFTGDKALLELSYNHYISLKNRYNKAALAFHRYLPSSMAISHELKLSFAERVVPLSRLVLPQAHVLWILSRLLEGCAWFAQEGIVHGGIHPESIFIAPKSHGVVFGSFYHLAAEGSRISTLSAKYRHWYPKEVFTDKEARTSTDLEMCKRLAAYLLGDSSGIGVKLRKSHHPAIIDFLLKRHDHAFECYDEYRKMLAANFEPKFHELII